MSKLREENAEGKMRQKQMERKLANVEDALQDEKDKTHMHTEEKEKLIAEKHALINTVKKLNKEVAKLDSFKRNLMQTLQEDGDNDGGDASGDRLVNSVLSNVDANTAYHRRSPQQSPARSTLDEDSYQGNSTRASPAPSSHRGGSVPASPLQPSNSNKVDGKEFFRQARSRLSYEHFSQFLQNIKELNAHKQTRAETLRRASDIFGAANKDLMDTFETLLVKHLPK